MLFYFPEPYKDEILYGLISRYDYYTGNKNAKKTQKELFKTDSIVPTIELTSNIKSLCKQFAGNSVYSEDYFVKYHTNLPFYYPFLDFKRRLDIKKSMINNNGKGIYTKIGIVAGGVCVKKGLYYCPKCVEDDIKKYGEPYFHRIHQLPGVMVCPTHKCLVKKYKITKIDVGRIKFIRLDQRYVDNEAGYIEDRSMQERLIRIAMCAKYILNSDLSQFNQASIKARYKYLLNDKRLLTEKGEVKQKKLIKLFKNYYSEKLLSILESNVDNSESNWIKLITRKSPISVHPIRHIFFILFLCKDAETFFNGRIYANSKFGSGPWPCLNPVANHYKNLVVNKCKITVDCKTRKSVGTFECDCGFVYSRKINYDNLDDIYKIGRIKKYGAVWEKKLLQLICSRQYSLRELGRIMKCDPKTVVRYRRKLGTKGTINSKMKIMENKPKVECMDYRKKYSKDILQLIRKHPEYTRTQIRKKLQKQYSWFYRNDSNWLHNKLPNINEHKLRDNVADLRVNWSKRDIETYENIKYIYQKLLHAEKPIRITKSIIGFKLGISALLDYHIDKLVKTKKYLNDIIETVEDFQIRRVTMICNDMIRRGIELKEWRVLRAAGLRTNCSIRVKEKINEYV